MYSISYPRFMIIKMRNLKWIWSITFQYTILILYTQFEIFNVVNSMTASFSCLNRTAGFYADISASCKIYHTCDEYGNKFTYHCPEETAFRQDALICDHAHLVRCQGNISSTTKQYIQEKKDNNTCIKSSVDKGQSLFHPFQVTQPMKTNNKIGYGFVSSSAQVSKNFNKTEIAENKIMNSFYPLNYINSTTNVPNNRSITPRTQYIPIINQHNENVLRKNKNFSIQSQSFHNGNKFIEKSKVDQNNYLYQNIHDTLHNFLKLSPNTFSGNTQAQENNVKTDQTTNDPNGLLKLSSTNYRNNPYLETLKSIQKNTKIPSVTISSTTTSNALTTTELPVYALTLSLKPLIPSELEYDPYYPKLSTTTESYYTHTHNIKEWSYIGNSTQTMWPTTHFELPSVLPDLNSLEDIVDRRKLLYIPRIKFN